MLLFKKIIYDTQFGNGTSMLTFFGETEDNEESVTEMTEDQVVKWLFQNESFQKLFFEDFFENPLNVKSYFSLKDPFTVKNNRPGKNNKPGDIDLILVDSNEPERAIAFECKRVKAISLDDQTAKVNNVEKIKKGVVQAGFYKDLGFHKCYLMVILLDDGRKKTTPNIVFRTTAVDHLKDLYNIPRKENLHEDVGIIFVKVEQTSGKHINLSGAFSFCVDREARPMEQSKQMTEKIIELIR